MGVCFRWTLLTLMIGGGFTGLVTTVEAWCQLHNFRWIDFLLCGLFAVLYALTIVSGLLFADNHERTFPMMISLILQTPWVSSPVLTYIFSAGFRVTVGIVNGRINAGLHFGSDWQLCLFQDRPWGICVNLFAVAMLALLVKYDLKTETERHS